VSWDTIGSSSLIEEITVAVSCCILLPLAFTVGTLLVGANDNDGDRRVLQAEF
jgi:hypothetical protein